MYGKNINFFNPLILELSFVNLIFDYGSMNVDM